MGLRQKLILLPSLFHICTFALLHGRHGVASLPNPSSHLPTFALLHIYTDATEWRPYPLLFFNLSQLISETKLIRVGTL